LSHFELSFMWERPILYSREGDLVYGSAHNAPYWRLPSGQKRPEGCIGRIQISFPPEILRSLRKTLRGQRNRWSAICLSRLD